MRIQTKIRHADIVAYLRGDAGPAIEANIRTVQKEDPAYTAFFDLINDIRKSPSLDLKRPPLIDKLSFKQLEEILESLLSGNASGNDRQIFMDHLLSSPSFYQRLMVKLSQMTPAMAIEEIPEFAGEFAQLRSDEELLKAAGVLRNRGRSPVVVPGRKLSERIREFIEKLLSPLPRPVYGGLATAVVAVMLVFVGISMTRVPYAQFWETPAFVELNGLRGSELRSSTRTSEASAVQSSYHNLRLLFTVAEPSYRNGEYAEVIEKMVSPGPLNYVQTLEKWETALGSDVITADSINIAEARQWLQNYYFYLGASHLEVFRNKKKALFEKADSHHITEAIQLLSKAQTLAEKYAIATQDRESYYLGLAQAIQNRDSCFWGLAHSPGKNQEPARRELAKVRQGSAYYSKAQELLEKLN